MKFYNDKDISAGLLVAPARGRGLKSAGEELLITEEEVAPARGRGLKSLKSWEISICYHVAPARGRGLK